MSRMCLVRWTTNRVVEEYPRCPVPGCKKERGSKKAVKATQKHNNSFSHIRNKARHETPADVVRLIEEEEQTEISTEMQRLDIYQAFRKDSKVWREAEININEHTLAHLAANGGPVAVAQYNQDSPYMTLLNIDR